MIIPSPLGVATPVIEPYNCVCVSFLPHSLCTSCTGEYAQTHTCTAASVLSQDVGPIPPLHPLTSQIVFTTLMPVQACPVFVSFDFVTLGLEREVIYSPLVNHIISGEKYYFHALLKQRGPRSC